MHVYRPGDGGPEIRDIQERLAVFGIEIDPAERDGSFGSSTQEAVREFQRRRHLRVDGLVGPDTWGQLVEAGYDLGDRALYVHAPHFRGDDVRALQRKLNALGFDSGKEDGLFGPQTGRAVREFQRNVGHEADGIVGASTIATLDRMRPHENAPSRALVREREQLRSSRGGIQGRLVALDVDPESPDVAVVISIARVIETELTAEGAGAVVLADRGGGADTSARALAANRMEAATCISLSIAAAIPEGTGPTCSYFGSRTTHSPAGMLLAGLILEELEGELAQRGRLQRLTQSILRETRMPAVIIEPLSVSEVGARQETEVELPLRVGRAIARGITRYFAG